MGHLKIIQNLCFYLAIIKIFSNKFFYTGQVVERSFFVEPCFNRALF